jgi:hypothetical protein
MTRAGARCHEIVIPRESSVTRLLHARTDTGRMDVIAVVIAVAAFAVLLALVEGLDRV